MPEENLPSADDPGPRFLGPSERPTSASVDAAECARSAGLPLRLDRTMALRFLAHGDYDVHRSFFEGIGLAPPLCPILRRPDGTLDVVEPAAAPPKLQLSFSEAAQGLRAALVAAVGESISPARRVGLTLSGGMDSSIVAAAAAGTWQRLGRASEDLRFYHQLPREGPTEVDHARAVARHLNHPLIEIRAEDGDPFEGNDEVLAAIDLSIAGGGMAQELDMWRRMTADGCEVLLNGDVGDELGNAYLFGGLGRSLRSAARTALRPLWRAVRRRPRPTPEDGLPTWLADRVRGLPPVEAEPPARRGLRGIAAQRDARLRGAVITAIGGSYRAFDQVFGTKSALSFIDRRVVDFVVSIPQRHLTRDPPKALMRQAFSDALPRAQRDRPKDQPLFEPELRRQVARYGAAWFERYLHGGALETLDIVPREATASILSAAASGSNADLHRGLRCVQLGAWWQAREARARSRDPGYGASSRGAPDATSTLGPG